MRKDKIQQIKKKKQKKNTVVTDFSNSKNSEGVAIDDIFFKRYCILILYFSVVWAIYVDNIN